MPKSILISNVLPQEALALIPGDITVDFNNDDRPLAKAELIRRLAGKDGLICHIISTIDEEVLAAAPGLKVVANVAVGFNNIDVAAARKRGVVVTNTPDVLTETTADFAWALLMAAARRVVEADHFARSGQWSRWQWDLLWGHDVHGKALGKAEVEAARANLGWPHEAFVVPDEVTRSWRAAGRRGGKDRKAWEARLTASPHRGEFERAFARYRA